MRDQAEGYVRAIQWNLNYYYNGCCSWSWYYPHHYAPYISDIRGFSNLKIEFDLGEPFLPYEQVSGNFYNTNFIFISLISVISRSSLSQQDFITCLLPPLDDRGRLSYKEILPGGFPDRSQWQKAGVGGGGFGSFH